MKLILLNTSYSLCLIGMLVSAGFFLEITLTILVYLKCMIYLLDLGFNVNTLGCSTTFSFKRRGNWYILIEDSAL